MNVFELRDNLVRDYKSYINSFIAIRDERIKGVVTERLEAGELWPDPLLQLNPSFARGATIDDLVAEGILHEQCRGIFRIGKVDGSAGRTLHLHLHQEQAIRTAAGGHNYVLTTGTGSGKSLAYIVPIVNHVLREGRGRGVRAIVVYPMNALANSQLNELGKFLGPDPATRAVTFERYTGQESEQDRQRICANPPDILLTNFVMLELILTRPREKPLVEAAQDLRFLVLDELHTYRGRQGADVAMLVRRAREAFGAAKLQCVGTSATLAGPGTQDEQRQEVARVAAQIFGDEVRPEHVIGETLRRATPELDFDSAAVRESLVRSVGGAARGETPGSNAAYVADAFSSWIESSLGLTAESGSGRLLRADPCTLSGDDGAASKLARRTGLDADACGNALQARLLASYQPEVANPENGFPPFAFRLHQFISRGDTVYASLESEADRYITLQGQQYVPGNRERLLYPLVFCRECGHEYYCVHLERSAGGRAAVKRDLADISRDDGRESGFLYVSVSDPWPDDEETMRRRLPEEWLEQRETDVVVRQNYRAHLPRRVRLDAAGNEGAAGIECSFVPAPFRFCLHCGASYGSARIGDYAKLAALATEGRSTATTVLSLSAVRHLRRDPGVATDARKLLSFTDNRQDASLQAGHFNDFVEVGLLRAAVYRAVERAGAGGLTHEHLVQRVFDALDLPVDQYSSQPDLRPYALGPTQEALRLVLGYRLYRDLERGWRITAPNLEQCGLLRIEYRYLPDACADQALWEKCHPALAAATPATREKVCRVLLDHMRRELAVKVDCLAPHSQETIRAQSSQHLVSPWAIDENETMRSGGTLFARPRGQHPREDAIYLSARSGFGQYLRRPNTFDDYGERITLVETDEIIGQILEALRPAKLVEPTGEDANGVVGYQVPAAALLWAAGDGTKPFHDPIRMPQLGEGGGRTNPFFVELYREVAREALGVHAREHTAQVPMEPRLEREKAFREGKLPVMYSSATMELGVDIASLNVVNLRNVPPTPANYAQRSGRAGRSGQPALVFTYCSSYRSHDQYFFRRPFRMVTGKVSPPRIELANEDLVRSHIHALWLAHTGYRFDTTLHTVLDTAGDDPTLAIPASVRDDLFAQRHRERALVSSRRLLESIAADLASADWYTPTWGEEVLDRIPEAFDRACDRWRTLYRAANRQQALQNKIVRDPNRSARDHERAKALRSEAEQQLALLTQTENAMEADFYTYRYLASEGFLPGYSFPRLPLSAYVPARRRASREEFISRPRFLAISEFGPRSFLYHEGARYRIERVILPLRDDANTIAMQTGKICPACGYLHPVLDGDGPDRCEQCQADLAGALRNLFRLENVSTRRVDRINSDEEERVRYGYDLVTVMRFAEHGGRKVARTAEARKGEALLARLSYGNAATVWRINKGWSRRGATQPDGFTLDLERGYWAHNQNDPDDQQPLSARTARVVPYVEDRRNCLLFEPRIAGAGEAFMASLQAALKNGIQAEFQLEEDELAAEPLPSRSERRQILLYEAAEGGAGVLRRLVDDREALARVARAALEICHYDPATGEDQHRAPRSRENCEAACYDCLMTYVNQMDHKLLDRSAVRDYLLDLAGCDLSTAPVGEDSRESHLERLRSLCGSELEKRWLTFLDQRSLRLPTAAQALVAECHTRPDFAYADHQTAIYVDGPPHDAVGRAARDAAQTACMQDLGYTVIRFGHEDDWQAIVRRYPSVFGKLA